MEHIGIKNTYGKLGLKPEEEKELRKLLEDKDISLGQLTRALVREWIKAGGPGFVLKTK